MGRKITKIIVAAGVIMGLSGMRLKAEEAPVMYRIRCEEADGKNGYYTKAAAVEIEHFDKTLRTRFRLEFPDKKEMTGILDEESDKVTLNADLFEEGRHYLDVWMEEEDGEEVEGTRARREIKIDTEAPEKPQFLFGKEQADECLCFPGETSVELKTSDRESGVERICYQVGKEEYETLSGGNVVITIPDGFAGKITAYAFDKAGNKSGPSYSPEIVCESRAPEIILKAPEGFEKWYNQELLTEVLVEETGIYSGIKSIVCSVNQKQTEKRTYGKREKTQEKLTIPVGQTSDIVVEAEDWAGNHAVRREKVLFDEKSPKLEIEGIENHMITGDEKEIVCRVADEHRISALKGSIVWTAPDGVKKSRMIENWKKDGEQYYAREKLRENGKYEISIEAADQAGNQSEKQMQVIIDRENPVIHGLEELNGKYMRFFEWTQEISAVVEDFTTYTYQIQLDGRGCEANRRYTKEGGHTLEVFVKDAAGNEAKAKAEFVIDHTPPEIRVNGADGKGEYERGMKLEISTEDESDYLEDIWIDGVRQRQDGKKKMFSYLLEKAGVYHVMVRAKDLAGNQSEKELRFEVLERKSFLDKIIGRDAGTGRKQDNREKADVSGENQEENGFWIWIVLTGIVLAAGSLGVGVWYKKILHKREDAG